MPQTVMGCLYPTNAEVMALQQELFPRFSVGRLAFNILPFKTTDYSQIIFQQPDIFRGMQPWRGLDKPTQTPKDKWNPFGKMLGVEPGYWGEHDYITEEFMTRAAQPGTCADVIDLTEQVARRQERLMERRFNRVEFLIWQALVYGKYEALSTNGQIIHQAYYNVQQVAASVPWSDFANSTPLADFRCIQLRGRGTSTSFGPDAIAYMNRVTANCLFKNQNPADVGKAALTACCTFMGPDIVNQQFAAQGLPRIDIYDEGFVAEDNNFYPYIPDGKVVIIGRRPGGVPVGHYFLTRNMTGCTPTSGFSQKLVDTCDREVPRRISIYDLHNGGPALEYPRAVVVLSTGCTDPQC